MINCVYKLQMNITQPPIGDAATILFHQAALFRFQWK